MNDTVLDAPESLDLSGKRVLVVDDVDVNREILIAILEDTGAILDEAGDGAEAVKMFSQNKYDLILMDLHMPRMDGFTAATEIRASDLLWAKTIPIISVSAENSAELSSKCTAAGINDCFSKPVEMKGLYKIISKWINAALYVS
jgi:CheY-like chemotaxis protein